MNIIKDYVNVTKSKETSLAKHRTFVRVLVQESVRPSRNIRINAGVSGGCGSDLYRRFPLS